MLLEIDEEPSATLGFGQLAVSCARTNAGSPICMHYMLSVICVLRSKVLTQAGCARRMPQSWQEQNEKGRTLKLCVVRPNVADEKAKEEAISVV